MKITIENHNNRLRLRWLYQGKRHTMAIAAEDELQKALAPFQLRRAEIDTELLINAVEIIELEAKLTKARAELEGLKSKGFNPLTAMFDVSLTTT